MADCSEKRPFICERSAARLNPRNLQEKLPPTQSTNDLAQPLAKSMAIFKGDLDNELADTIATLETHFAVLLKLKETYPTAIVPLSPLIRAIALLKNSTIRNLIEAEAKCPLLKNLHDTVLAQIDKVLQNESALPTVVSGKTVAVQLFLKKLKKRHLDIQSAICSICSNC